METIRLQDGSTVEASINGITLDGNNGYALLIPDAHMSLTERLAESAEIRVERNEQGRWNEVKTV